MTTERFRDLLARYLDDQLSPGEVEELVVALREKEHVESVDGAMEAAFVAEVPVASLPDNRAEIVFEKIIARTRMKAPVRRMRWARWVAAASVLIGVSMLGYWMLDKRRHQAEPPVVAADVKAPDKNRAMITLGDGRVVFLDSAGNGEVVTMNGVRLVKEADGAIAYNEQETRYNGQLEYNTLTNPRGSKVIDMKLGDGSHVWLNAGSSLTYPVVFPAAGPTRGSVTRTVKMEGEAYFEVNPDKKRPFMVEANGVQTEVLGTHFNINAYDDEKEVRVTLLEGSVRASKNNESVILQPGQQAVAANSRPLAVHNNVDVEEVMAWRHGQFLFSNMLPDVLLRQVARWYGIEVRYTHPPAPIRLGGGLSKDLPLSKIIELLEANGVHVKLEGRILTVL